MGRKGDKLRHVHESWTLQGIAERVLRPLLTEWLALWFS